jgi:hypothetical protein
MGLGEIRAQGNGAIVACECVQRTSQVNKNIAAIVPGIDVIWREDECSILMLKRVHGLSQSAQHDADAVVRQRGLRTNR